MALNSIANLTYINQASSATSAFQAGNMPHQTPLNHALFHEQMQKIEEVRPTEETNKTQDREGNGKREFEEDKKDNEEKENFQDKINIALFSKKPKKNRTITEDEMLMRPENHMLDIKG